MLRHAVLTVYMWLVGKAGSQQGDASSVIIQAMAISVIMLKHSCAMQS
jgi:hypothetical protein